MKIQYVDTVKLLKLQNIRFEKTNLLLHSKNLKYHQNGKKCIVEIEFTSSQMNRKKLSIFVFFWGVLA